MSETGPKDEREKNSISNSEKLSSTERRRRRRRRRLHLAAENFRRKKEIRKVFVPRCIKTFFSASIDPNSTPQDLDYNSLRSTHAHWLTQAHTHSRTHVMARTLHSMEPTHRLTAISNTRSWFHTLTHTPGIVSSGRPTSPVQRRRRRRR